MVQASSRLPQLRSSLPPSRWADNEHLGDCLRSLQKSIWPINLSELEQLQLLFQKIDVKNEDGGTQFMDNWAA